MTKRTEAEDPDRFSIVRDTTFDHVGKPLSTPRSTKCTRPYCYVLKKQIPTNGAQSTIQELEEKRQSMIFLVYSSPGQLTGHTQLLNYTGK